MNFYMMPTYYSLYKVIEAFVKRVFKKKIKTCTVCYTELPYDVQQVGKLYPVIKTLMGNKADGTIQKFILEDNKLRVGQALFQNNNKEIWIHLGHDYFKNTVKL